MWTLIDYVREQKEEAEAGAEKAEDRADEEKSRADEAEARAEKLRNIMAE